MTRAKKVLMIKNYSSHARQPHQDIFEIGWCCGLIFMALSWNFDQLAQNGDIKNKILMPFMSTELIVEEVEYTFPSHYHDHV